MTSPTQERITTLALVAGAYCSARRIHWRHNLEIDPLIGGVLAGVAIWGACMTMKNSSQEDRSRAVSRWDRVLVAITCIGVLQARYGFLKTRFNATHPVWTQFTLGMNAAALAFRVITICEETKGLPREKHLPAV